MAIQKEIWEKSIVEGLFAPNSFLSKAFNADEYVEAGKIVHIPQAGAASKVEKNRTSLPATVKQRTDTDKTFELAAFTTDPVLIPDAASPYYGRTSSPCMRLWPRIFCSPGVLPRIV